MVGKHKLISSLLILPQLLPWEVEKLYFDANMMIFVSILALLTLQQICSAMLVLAFILSPLVIRDRVLYLSGIKPNGNIDPTCSFHRHSIVAPCLKQSTL